MRKALVTVLGIVTLIGLPVWGEQAGEEVVAPKKERKEKQEVQLVDLTVVGKLEQQTRQTKQGKTVNEFSLTDKDGTVVKLSASAMDLTPFVGKTVTVIGKGVDKMGKGARKVMFKEIVTVTPVEDTPAAPAADAPKATVPAPAPAPDPVK